eukprot:3804270-Prymnesium_polylepis.1
MSGDRAERRHGRQGRRRNECGTGSPAGGGAPRKGRESGAEERTAPATTQVTRATSGRVNNV